MALARGSPDSQWANFDLFVVENVQARTIVDESLLATQRDGIELSI
jgi:hypothetical protein